MVINELNNCQLETLLQESSQPLFVILRPSAFNLKIKSKERILKKTKLDIWYRPELGDITNVWNIDASLIYFAHKTFG